MIRNPLWKEYVRILSPFVGRREPVTSGAASVTPGMANRRPQEAVFPQEAPSAPRQGDTPSSPARMPIAITSYPDPDVFGGWTRDDFMLGGMYGPTPHASYPLGAASPFDARANIKRPSSVAYGSLFELDSQIYGLG